MTPTDSYLLKQASCRASLLVAAGVFRSADWEDLTQEMVLDCLRRSPKFNPSRGNWQGFVQRVVRNHAAVLVTRRYRNVRREVLADDLTREGTGNDPDDPLGATHKHDIEPELQMRIDVQRILNGLTPQLRNLALLLSELPMSEACAKTGKSRSRVYQMTWQLRDAFLRAGFRPCCLKKSAVQRLNNPRTEIGVR